jgi:hypothetical protein
MPRVHFTVCVLYKLSFVGTIVRMVAREVYFTGDGFKGVISKLYISPPYKAKVKITYDEYIMFMI